MNKRIFVTRKIPDIGIKILEDKGYKVDYYEEDRVLEKDELIRHIRRVPYDAVLCLLTDRIDAEIFDSAPSVKIYSNYASGFDNIDLGAAKKRGIIVTNAPADLSAEAVAEHTIALILALAARIVEADEFVRRGKYEGWSPMNFIGTDVFGKTIGIVGAGRIGRRVAYYAKGLGMKILYTDIERNTEMEEKFGAIYCSSVDELLPKVDIVTLHVPLLDSTRHLINEVRLKMMKSTSFLINTSRGPVVEEKALERALKDKIITAAALDVFEFEPDVSSELIKLQNVILTPHIASASDGARNQMAEIAANNIIDFLEGRVPKNIVNP
ncbi:MAG: D-glycerate dehydrogenase [Candidatus Paceibacterota bacterium]|jgi:lactate dehydrogenase-like 2-hydroxyacid dehydrogenase